MSRPEIPATTGVMLDTVPTSVLKSVALQVCPERGGPVVVTAPAQRQLPGARPSTVRRLTTCRAYVVTISVRSPSTTGSLAPRTPAAPGPSESETGSPCSPTAAGSTATTETTGSTGTCTKRWSGQSQKATGFTTSARLQPAVDRPTSPRCCKAITSGITPSNGAQPDRYSRRRSAAVRSGGRPGCSPASTAALRPTAPVARPTSAPGSVHATYAAPTTTATGPHGHELLELRTSQPTARCAPASSAQPTRSTPPTCSSTTPPARFCVAGATSLPAPTPPAALGDRGVESTIVRPPTSTPCYPSRSLCQLRFLPASCIFMQGVT